jgi:predicted TIM-barrel fold metal-dependent hydrolase
MFIVIFIISINIEYMIIDSHCHVYPSFKRFITGKDNLKFQPINKIKKLYKKVMIPYLAVLHKAQESARLVPEKHLPLCDKLIASFGAINTLVDSSVSDLFTHMDDNSINQTIIIAHPPYIPNKFVIELANHNKKIIPIVNLPYNSPTAETDFINYLKLGAKGLKIHAAADGGETESAHYSKLLQIANEHKLPVIIHTGCIHVGPLYKDPTMGHAEHFDVWFDRYPNCKFILAHMNYHHPDIAIQLCKQYPNVFLETSWQPKNKIINAIKEVGAEKVLFGSDWPIMGNNIKHSLDHLYSAFDEGLIAKDQLDLILGINAYNIFVK